MIYHDSMPPHIAHLTHYIKQVNRKKLEIRSYKPNKNITGP